MMYFVVEYPSGDTICSGVSIGVALRTVVGKLRYNSNIVSGPKNTWVLKCGVRTVLSTDMRGVICPNYTTLTGQERLHLHRQKLPVSFFDLLD